METTILNIRKFPCDIHHAAKVEAVKEGITLREWFVKACKEKLERDAQK